MKCPTCGSNLTIDDEKCLFCGTDNPFAVKHRKEMHHFTKEFNETKDAVMEKSHHVNRWAVKITLIAILVAANLGVLFFINNISDFEYLIKQRELINNYEIYTAKLDELEANRDYIAFARYCNDNEFYIAREYDEYYAVSRACDSFNLLYKHTMNMVMDGEMDGQRLEYATDNIEYVYEFARKPDYFDDEGKYKEQHLECLEDLVEDMEAFLQTYYGLSDEEIESFEELSKARKQILLEEGFVRNE